MATIWTDKKRSLFFGLPLSFTKYICTDEKFIVEAGMLSTREDEIRLYRILDLTLERSFMQRIFGLGPSNVTPWINPCQSLRLKI